MGFRQYLLHQSVVSPAHLHTAILCQQKEPHKKIGEILCHHGFVCDEDLLKALETYTGIAAFPGMHHVHLFDDFSLLKNTQEDLSFTPFAIDHRGVHVAMLDAENILLRDQLKVRYQRPIIPYHITHRLLDALNEAVRTHVAKHTEKHEEKSLCSADLLTLESIMNQALRLEASDIHFQPMATYFVIRLRIDGLLTHFYEGSLEAWSRILSQIKILAGMDVAITRMPQHGRLQHPFAGRHVDCRISSHPMIDGENVVIRLLDTKKSILSLDELGFSNGHTTLLRSLLKMQHGLILFTGPTGSGKTTSLYALLSEMDTNTRHIATLEQPVEYALFGIRQSEITQNMTFCDGIRSLLRQDPDVMLIGEIRDEETAQMAFRASMTGHLVLSTLHAHDVLSSPHRLMNLGIAKDVIISQVLAVMSQRLVRRLCLECNNDSALKTHCKTCEGRGFKGRLALFEGVVFTPNLRHHMMAEDSFHSLHQRPHKTLWDDGEQKVQDNLTTYDELIRVLGPRDYGDHYDC